MGSGGGQVVSVPAFYSDDPSSNPTFVKFVFEKNKNKQKEARVGPFLKKVVHEELRNRRKRNLNNLMLPASQYFLTKGCGIQPTYCGNLTKVPCVINGH